MTWLWQKAAKNPLAGLSLAAIAGIVTADCLVSLPWLWLCGLLLTLAAWRRVRRAVFLAVLCFWGFGLLQQHSLLRTRDHALRRALIDGQRVSATLIGTFVRAPMIRDSDAGPSNRLARLRVSTIKLHYREDVLPGPVDVRIWLHDPTFVPEGGEYECSGLLSLPQPPLNPGGFDAETYSLRQGLVAELATDRIQPVGPRELSLRLVFLSGAEHMRHWIMDRLSYGLDHRPDGRTLITTMALGTAQDGDDKLEEPFRNSGTLHVFAVSGMHIALMVWIIWFLLKHGGVRRSRAVMILVPLAFGYAYLTGWVPSAARAAFMASVILAAPLLNRSQRILNSIGFAVLILLAFDTQQLFQPGFQLSFGILLAIVLGVNLIEARFKRFTELDPFLPPSLADWRARLSRNLRRHALGSSATSLVAWLGSLPLAWWHFGTCTPIAILANLALVPLSELSLILVVASMLVAGFGSIPLLGWIFSPVLAWLNQLNALCAACMLGLATAFATIPGGHFALPPSSLRERAPVTLRVLSMRPGESAQLLSSSGQHWWLDCGGARFSNRYAIPFLQQCGITHIDGMILSHADSDHIGAAPELMKRYGAEQIYAGPNEPWRLDSRATAMWTLSKQADSRLHPLQAGDTLPVGSAKIKILYPRATDLGDKADDRTLIVRIDCGRTRLLWCNDAGFSAEKSLLERRSAEDLRADVLIRNQHASDLSALIEFLQAVQPQVVITSNAPSDPAERLPLRLRQWCDYHNRLLWDTSKTGMVQINAWPDRLTLTTWLTQEHTEVPAAPPP